MRLKNSHKTMMTKMSFSTPSSKTPTEIRIFRKTKSYLIYQQTEIGTIKCKDMTAFTPLNHPQNVPSLLWSSKKCLSKMQSTRRRSHQLSKLRDKNS